MLEVTTSNMFDLNIDSSCMSSIMNLALTDASLALSFAIPIIFSEFARAIYGPRATSFGHGGAGGSTGFADPEVGLSIGITLNKMEFARSRSENRTLQICDLIRNELGVN